MVRSMTGFGAAEGDVGSVRVTVELRSVNHRFFNPSIKLPSLFSRWETEVREALRERVARGHVSLTARVEERPGQAAAIDDSAFAAAAGRLRALNSQHALAGEVDVASVLRIPGVIVSGEEASLPDTPAPLLAVIAAAVDAFTISREAEGSRMEVVVSERLDAAVGTLERIAARAPERITAHREKLRARIVEIVGGVAVDEQRLATEVALLAERLDVGEELDRFRAHMEAFRETLAAAKAGPVGKRLGFLLQEMLREANTTGSKANDAPMQQEVVSLKEELERIREQVENLE